MVAQVENFAPPVTRTPRKQPRIDVQDAEFIAKNIARGMTETEAVTKLDRFTPNSWFVWKCKAKNGLKFTNVLLRMKQARIDGLLGEIEKAGQGTNGVRHDWRAADRLLSIADSRFIQNRDQGQAQAQPMLSEDALGRLVAMYYQAKPLPLVTTEPSPAKAIDCPCVSNGEASAQDYSI